MSEIGPSCIITELNDDAEDEQPQPAPGSSIHPPPGCQPITPDGGVLKMILEEGMGEVVPHLARCLVHYVGSLADTGEIIMDTKTESQTMQPVQVIAGKDTSSREVGLNLAVSTMKIGEKAMVYVEDPKYGYGPEGSFSFPAVPPNSRIVYAVELVDWEEHEGEEGEDPDNCTGLLFEERLERAEERRGQGNTLFAEGKYKEALGKYAVALSYLDEDLMMQLEGPYIDQAHQVKIPIHLNMAACQIRMEDFHTAIYNCSEVLNMDADNVKALFRRGKARLALGQTDGASSDLEAAYKRAPSDKAILKELHALRQTVKDEKKAQAALFKGQFGSAPAASPQASVTEKSAEDVRSGSTTVSKKVASVPKEATGKAKPSPHAPAGLISTLTAFISGLFAWLASLLGIRIPVALGRR